MSRLFFTEEAKKWNEAIPIGNGFLGAMIFGAVQTERIQINEDSMWSGGFRERVNPDAKENLEKTRKFLQEGNVIEAQKLAERSMYGTCPHMQHYQTLGDVWIHFTDVYGKQKIEYVNQVFPVLTNEVSEITEYERELDLEQSLGMVRYCKNGKKQKREFFASNPSQVIIYRIQAGDGDTVNVDIEVTRKDNRRGKGLSYCDGVYADDDRRICLYGVQGGKNGIGFELAVQVKSSGGKQFRMGSRVVVEKAEEVTLYITARTTFRSKNPHQWCMEVLDRVSKKTYDQVKAEHCNDYRTYYDNCRVCLGRLARGDKNDECDMISTPERLKRLRRGEEDIGLYELYFDYAKYLLISSSREGSLPANLQGIWNEEFDPSWGSKYTININTQMNYWIAEKTGLSNMHIPLLEHLKRMYPNGKKVAENMYGARGFCCHHNTDLWGDCAPQDSNMCSTIWPMGAAWLCLHLIEHYTYTKDQQFFEEYYGIIRDAVLFFIDYLVKNEEGKWVTGPSSSPENIYCNENGEYGTLCMGPYMDMEILTELFGGFLKISEEKGVADEITREAEEKLAEFPSLKIGKYGQIQEWQKDYEEVDIGHRHISQLFALYPGEYIRKDKTPELAKAANVTLERRLRNGSGHTGWSRAWIILLYARLWDGDNAWFHLKELLKGATLDNLLNNHPPFQIDGNFGGAAGILEMIVQDFEKEVYLLPALPKEISEGFVKGVRLKCGAVLDMEWEKGVVTFANVTALRDCDITFISKEGKRSEMKLRKSKKVKYEGDKV